MAKAGNALKLIVSGIISVMAGFVGASIIDTYVSGLTFSLVSSSLVTGLGTLTVVVLVFAGVYNLAQDF